MLGLAIFHKGWKLSVGWKSGFLNLPEKDFRQKNNDYLKIYTKFENSQGLAQFENFQLGIKNVFLNDLKKILRQRNFEKNSSCRTLNPSTC